MEVRDRVCVVTGGGSGIGRALCQRFAADGARAVVVVDRNGDGAAAVVNEIEGRVNALAHVIDVGDESQVTAMLTGVENSLGPVDVLCNNAGIASGGDPLRTPIDEWQRQWQINVMAHVYAVRVVLPGMLARGEGHIQYTASMAGILTSHGNLPYATTKHAVVGLAEWMSVTYHDKGIRSYLLAPLGVRTPMLGDQADSEWARSAAGPIAEPEDVAQMVVDAFAEERFLILTNPVAQDWMDFKTKDLEKWLTGMRKLQARIEAAEA
jgi:NAD(P)-dependent dehydrogenase (short-subunit alcohol dehydrogenase family)